MRCLCILPAWAACAKLGHCWLRAPPWCHCHAPCGTHSHAAAPLSPSAHRTLALIKPEAVPHAGKILHSITQAGFRVAALRMCRLTPDDARQFYAAHVAQPCYPALVACMSSGPVVAMELVAPAAVAKWRALLGPTDAVAARREAPGSIRALFGSDEMRNAAHGSDAPDTAAAELSFFFGTGRGGWLALGCGCSQCVGGIQCACQLHACASCSNTHMSSERLLARWGLLSVAGSTSLPVSHPHTHAPTRKHWPVCALQRHPGGNQAACAQGGQRWAAAGPDAAGAGPGGDGAAAGANVDAA